METMTKEYLLHYLESQALVNQIVIEEARRKTYDERWQDLEMLFLGGSPSELTHVVDEEDERVRLLWVHLDDRLGRNGAKG